MRVVVTGATGNLGSALLRQCALQGHEVVGVARRVPDPSMARLAHRWVRCDLAWPEGADALAGALRGADALVHLAWALQPMRDRGYQRRVNLGGTSLCLAAAERAELPQVVLASSVGAYSPGRPPGPVDESWPTGGVPGCGYSQDKAALEAVLRDVLSPGGGAGRHAGTRVAWVRPALVGQWAAGGELLRYGLPLLTPRWLLGRLPWWALDRDLRLQVVHADDVADAVLRILDTGAEGPFNLVAEPVLGATEVAAAFGARPVHLPWRVSRAAAALAWWARVGPLDPAWITMAHTVPPASAARARTVLGWSPAHDAESVLRELARGMAAGAGAPSLPLRPRRHLDDVRRVVRDGPVSDRTHP
jgi:nucleoside-diphosphate-sugar epimerase